jgi:hypothetical protein
MGFNHVLEDPVDRPELQMTQAAGGGVVLYEERDADAWIHADVNALVDVQEARTDE